MYGYSEEEALRLNAAALIADEARAEMHMLWERLRHGEKAPPCESRRRAKDGRIFKVWLTTTVLLDEAGNPFAIALTERRRYEAGSGTQKIDDSETRSKAELIADLQAHRVELEMQNYELKEAQQQLEESRDRYAALYDYAPVGYFTLDKAGRVLEINLTGSTMLEVERAHLVGQPFITRVAEGDIHAFLQHLHDIFHTSGNIVTRLRLKFMARSPASSAWNLPPRLAERLRARR